MRWVYLSPHFDDVVLSCGGMVWEQVRAGTPVAIWTICAGAPGHDAPLSDFAQQLHARWQTGVEAVAVRLAEDESAVQRLGAASRLWDLPDCIYRRLPDGPQGSPGSWLVNGEEDLWLQINPLEQGIVERLSDWLVRDLSAADQLVSPLTLGNHVDHFLVRAAAEHAAARVGCDLWYYPDYPYAAARRDDLPGKIGADWQQYCQRVSSSALHAWQEAVACYTSQLSTFWSGREHMDAELEAYWRAGGGTCLWQPARANGE